MYITLLFLLFIKRGEISKHDDLHERSTTWYSSAFGSSAKGVREFAKGLDDNFDSIESKAAFLLACVHTRETDFPRSLLSASLRVLRYIRLLSLAANPFCI